MQGNKRWELNCGDIGNFDISDKQMEIIKEADKVGMRFVDIGKAVINIAFIRGAVCYTERPKLPIPASAEFAEKKLTDEEREANLKLIKAMRKNLFNKGA